ncbi:MAG: 4-alpha-glucanotransferase [Eubacteriaceae bacterium]|jgi:4-alpha-glucanotransferase
MKSDSIMSRLFRMIKVDPVPEKSEEQKQEPVEKTNAAATESTEPVQAEQPSETIPEPESDTVQVKADPEDLAEIEAAEDSEMKAAEVIENKAILKQRSNGVLMHITSLPSRYGIGSFGAEARHFADLLKDAHVKAWQVLPFCPADSCHSPYKSVSSFAGNPMFIDLEQLRDEGYLNQEELDSCVVEDPWGIDFARVTEDRNRVFKIAFSRINEQTEQQMLEFAAEHTWVDDYALFMAATEKYGYNWQEWPQDLRDRKPDALEDARAEFAETILYHAFLQYVFFSQWKKDKAYINSLGIKVIGDMPFYVSYESSDVWSNQNLFDLKEDGKPAAVAGVPPDFFSKTGQLWGNPLYDWKKMKAENYQWWMNRIGHALKVYDVLRIDHFRAFANYYSVPADEDTAMNGTWIDGPGQTFFDVLDETFDNPEIIAEDLGGESDPEVMKLIKQTGLPGMRVMEMAFVSYGDNPHYPFNYIPNCVAYLGTHDNNTLLGYLGEDLTAPQRDYALQYVDFYDHKDNWEEFGPNSGVVHAFIRSIWQSSSNLVIIQLQDLMGYGSDCRMNLPGTASGNWSFRIERGALDTLNTEWLKYFNMTYQR